MDHQPLITHLPTTASMPMLATPKTPRRAIIYLRCSTEQQSSYQDQARACRSYADRHGVAVIRVIPETASARGRYAEARPVFRDVLKHARALDAIVLVAEVTRLSRNAEDARVLWDTGISFHVADRDGFIPLGRKTLISKLRKAAQNSSNKSKAQRKANQTRDKVTRRRGRNFDRSVRERGRQTRRERAANDVLRAAQCLAGQVDLDQMTHAQKACYLTRQGVTREVNGRPVDWTEQAFRRKWKTKIAPAVNEVRQSKGWFYFIEI